MNTTTINFFIPIGMAHGFLTLEDHTIFSYKCSDFYHKESEEPYCLE
jgi:dTDP-4-dehydrorhamnose 3,5-epimerase